MKSPTYSFLQISCVLMLSIGMMTHVLVIPLMFDVTGRDSWLSVIVATVLFLPVFVMVAYMMKRTNQQPFQPWLAQNYGKAASFIFALLFSVVLLFSAAITLKDMITWTASSYLPATPPFAIAFSLIVLALYAVSKGLRTIAYSASILLPLVILFGEFVMTSNFQHKDYSLLLPLFESGKYTFVHGIVYIGSCLIEIMMLLLLQHKLSSTVKTRYVILLGLVLFGLTLGPLMGSLAEFGPVEAKVQRYPAFEEWRLVKIGNFIEHVDFLSIFQWVCGAFIRICLILYLFSQLYSKSKLALYICAALLLGMVTYRVGDITFLSFLRNVYFPLFFAVMLAALLILFVLVVFSKKTAAVKPT